MAIQPAATCWPGSATTSVASWTQARRRLSDGERAKLEVIAAVTDYLESDNLRFSMELSIEPVAAAVGVAEV